MISTNPKIVKKF